MGGAIRRSNRSTDGGPAGARRWLRAEAWRPHRWLLGLLAFAFALRLGVVLGTPGYAPWGDPADYDRVAATLVLTGDWATTQYAVPGSPTAFRAPAYPGMLAAVYWVVGLDPETRWTAARILGALLGTATVALVWGLARALWTDVRIARVAGATAAVLPSLVWLNGGLVSEVLFVPLVLAALLAVLRFRRDPRLRWALMAGGLAGLAALTRSNGLAVVLPVVLGLAVTRTGWRAPSLALLACTLVLAPWVVRNERAFGEFLPTGTQSGYTLSGVWNPESAQRGDHFAHSWVPPEVPALRDLFDPPRFTEAELDAQLRSRALTFAREHPGFVVEAAALRALRLFHLGPGHAFVADLSARELGVPGGFRPFLGVGAWLLLVGGLMAGGLVLRRRMTLGAWWLWLVPALVFLTAAPLVGAPRYRIPLDPFLVLLSAAALVTVLSARRRGSSARAR